MKFRSPSLSLSRTPRDLALVQVQSRHRERARAMCDKSIEYSSNKREIIGRHIERGNNIDLRLILVVLIKKEASKRERENAKAHM